MRLKADKASGRDTKKERRRRRKRSSCFGSAAIIRKSRKVISPVTSWDGKRQ